MTSAGSRGTPPASKRYHGTRFFRRASKNLQKGRRKRPKCPPRGPPKAPKATKKGSGRRHMGFKIVKNLLKIEAALGRRFEASEKKVCCGLLGRPGGLCGLRGEDFRRGKPRPHTAGQSKVWNYMSGAWSRKDWQGPGRGLGTPCPWQARGRRIAPRIPPGLAEVECDGNVIFWQK